MIEGRAAVVAFATPRPSSLSIVRRRRERTIVLCKLPGPPPTFNNKCSVLWMFKTAPYSKSTMAQATSNCSMFSSGKLEVWKLLDLRRFGVDDSRSSQVRMCLFSHGSVTVFFQLEISQARKKKPVCPSIDSFAFPSQANRYIANSAFSVKLQQPHDRQYD